MTLWATIAVASQASVARADPSSEPSTSQSTETSSAASAGTRADVPLHDTVAQESLGPSVAEGTALLEQNLHHAAAQVWVQAVAASTQDVGEVAVQIARAATSLGREDAAVPALELAALRAPDDARVWSALARVTRGRSPRTSQAAAARAASLSLDASLDAAELAREAGARRSALRHNSAVTDSKARLRQRLSVLLDARAWNRVLALAEKAEAAGLLHGPVAYALAYASFQVGDDVRAAAFLDKAQDAAIFEQVTALRSAIATCASAPDDTPCAR